MKPYILHNPPLRPNGQAGIDFCYRSLQTSSDSFNQLFKGENEDECDTRSLADIPMGYPYIIYINVINTFFSETIQYDWMNFSSNGVWRDRNNEIGQVHTQLPMCDRIRTDSINGLVHWIVTYNTEADMINAFDYDKLLSGLCCEDHPHNVTFGTATELENNQVIEHILSRGINVVHTNTLPHIVAHGIDTDALHSRTAKNIHFKSLYYHGLPRAHRTHILGFMNYRNFLNESLYSVRTPLPNPIPKWHIDRYRNQLTPLYEHSLNDLGGFQQTLDEPARGEFHTSVETIHSSSCAFYIAGETISDCTYSTDTGRDVCTFLSEKAFKPFALGLPFIIYGNVYTIEVLRKKGFDVFDDVVDHSYDTIEDNNERMAGFLTELERLHLITLNEWRSIHCAIHHRIIKNANHLRTMDSRITLPP